MSFLGFPNVYWLASAPRPIHHPISSFSGNLLSCGVQPPTPPSTLPSHQGFVFANEFTAIAMNRRVWASGVAMDSGVGRAAMDGAGPIAILEAPAGPPGHLEASAGLRPPPDPRRTPGPTRVDLSRARPKSLWRRSSPRSTTQVMNNTKTRLRNALKEDHLNVAMGMQTLEATELDSFPSEEAIAIWPLASGAAT
jgi:hypothetical protein